ncbi:APC family permease [Mycetocola tolaasinivorans]|uniref:APC family permease n=1 Tax=Mycetocola tolaasinivorans TaxID=76635 RepID=A0A3L7AB15_9MICO|nr:APC family permease [Mycetocola tolaasinivorans]
MIASTVIGLGSTAPLYSLAATLGFIVMAAGAQAPIALIVAFVPMCLTAFAYRELNTAVPDAGTAFTWATKAFGPRAGWMAGWGVFVAGVIVMSSQTEVASKYLLLMIGDGSLAKNHALVVGLGALIIVVMTWVSYRAVEAGALTQNVLMALQYIAIIAFCIGLALAIGNGAFAHTNFSWEWFNPFAADNPAGFIQAVLLAIFIYWGWDTCLSLAEETKNPRTTPGLAALLSTVVLLITYIGMTLLAMMHAGVGTTGIGLANPDGAEDVFYALRTDALGDWGWVLVFAVFVSALSTCQTTILPTARGTLAMGVYRGLPRAFAKITPKYSTPGFSTIFMGVVSIVFYVGMSLLSGNILADTIESTSLAVAMYYTITSFACIWFFRRNLFDSGRNLVFRLVLPLIGGLMMAAVFIISAVNMFDPNYGETQLLGTSGTFVMGVGSLLLGLVVMAVWSRFPGAKEFFTGRSLNRETPVMVPES